MTKTIKIILISLTALTALYFVFHDRQIDEKLIDSIGDKIPLDNAALKEFNHDKIILDFEKYKMCGNDPTTYYYSTNWDSIIKNKLVQRGFKTIIFDDDSIQLADSIPRISILCYLKNNDITSTEVKLHFIYQKYINYKGDNILVKDIILKLKNNSWTTDI